MFLCLSLPWWKAYKTLIFRDKKPILHSQFAFVILNLIPIWNWLFCVQANNAVHPTVHRRNVSIFKEPKAAHHWTTFLVLHCLFHVQIKVCERVCVTCAHLSFFGKQSFILEAWFGSVFWKSKRCNCAFLWVRGNFFVSIHDIYNYIVIILL